MSTKAIFISDLHWGIKKSNNNFMESMKTYFEEEVLTYCLDNDISDIYILGDFWDSRESTSVKLSNIVFDVLKMFESHNIKLIVLIGNHDITYRTNIQTHGLKFFSLFSNIEVIDKLTERTIHGKNVVMYPWQVDETFQDVQWKDKDLCLGHFEINGCLLHANSLFDGGSTQNWFFKNFKQTFSGHFHTHSETYHDGHEIIYCGSPYHLTRHDRNTDRGFIVYDFADGSWERVWSKHTLRFVDLELGDKVDKVLIKGNNIDVNVKIDNDFDPDVLAVYLKSLEKYEPLSVTVNPTYELIKEKDDAAEYDSSKVKTIPDMVHWKLSNLDIKKKLQKDIESYINNLLDECSTI